MTMAQITNEALALPLHDRMQLAQCLWDSVNKESGPGLNAEEEAMFAEAERRDDEVERGVVQPVSHAEVMAALNKVVQCD
jgi:putative addiction module component (TIGR02574 family)